MSTDSHASHDHQGASDHGQGPVGFQLDAPNMRILTIIIVVVALVVIGTGFGLASLLGVKGEQAKLEMGGKKSADTIATKADAAKYTKAAGVYGPEEAVVSLIGKQHIPVDAAVKAILANPARLQTKVVWPDLPAQDDPAADAAAAAAPAAAAPAAAAPAPAAGN